MKKLQHVILKLSWTRGFHIFGLSSCRESTRYLSVERSYSLKKKKDQNYSSHPDLEDVVDDEIFNDINSLKNEMISGINAIPKIFIKIVPNL